MQACPDCPAVRANVLEHLLPTRDEACAFRVATIGERETLPHAWFGKYALGLVRRGIVVRQRVDEDGVATAIDVVGPGGAILLGHQDGAAAYAVTETLVCLCSNEKLATCAALPTAQDMVQLQAVALDRMDRLADARNRPNAHARTQALLETLAVVLAPPRRLELIPAELQRRDLAALLALRPESLSRVLADLERDGVVTRSHDGLRLIARA